MSLHDVIRDDAAAVFCNAQDFAEVVTYLPIDGTPREIYAIVDRQQANLLSESGEVLGNYFTVEVVNSETEGIASHQINVGGDQIEFPTRVGGPPSVRSIVALVSNDEGMLSLECR